MNQRGLLLIALLGTLFVLYLSSNRQKRSPPLPAQIQAQNKYYLEDFTASTYSQTGELQRVLRGKTLQQSAHSHEITVDAPHIQLIEAGSPIWVISAKNAWLDATQENAKLKGKVVAVEQRPPQSTLKTAELEINLAAQLAHTTSNVSITQEPHAIEGEGLQANFPAGTLKILAKVQSVYIP
jgi:LPS export ABC transporter protein LptC